MELKDLNEHIPLLERLRSLGVATLELGGLKLAFYQGLPDLASDTERPVPTNQEPDPVREEEDRLVCPNCKLNPRGSPFDKDLCALCAAKQAQYG